LVKRSKGVSQIIYLSLIIGFGPVIQIY
jgi:hypothetical protein